jgi:hypothetical protein
MLRGLSSRPPGLVGPLPRGRAGDVLRVRRRRGRGLVAPLHKASKGGEELLGKALDELQETQCLLDDQVKCCAHLDLDDGGRLTHPLAGRALGRRALRRRPRLALAGRDGVQPTRHGVDLADSTVHGRLEDLVAGGRQQLPTGCTQRLRARAPGARGRGAGGTARTRGGGRGHH